MSSDADAGDRPPAAERAVVPVGVLVGVLMVGVVGVPVEGGEVAVELGDVTATVSFMPLVQWPATPQMK